METKSKTPKVVAVEYAMTHVFADDAGNLYHVKVCKVNSVPKVGIMSMYHCKKEDKYLPASACFMTVPAWLAFCSMTHLHIEIDAHIQHALNKKDDHPPSVMVYDVFEKQFFADGHYSYRVKVRKVVGVVKVGFSRYEYTHPQCSFMPAKSCFLTVPGWRNFWSLTSPESDVSVHAKAIQSGYNNGCYGPCNGVMWSQIPDDDDDLIAGADSVTIQ